MIKKKFPIYTKYLKVKSKKPLTYIMAAVTPFSQATLGSMVQIFIMEKDMTYIALGSTFYWLMFALNGKRIALGGWKAIILFIIFATLGTLFGVQLTKIL